MEFCKDTLDLEHRIKGIDKTAILLEADPYNLPNSSILTGDDIRWPDLSYGDIWNYLVAKKSTYAHEQFKNYKSLEAYDRCDCGWVSSVGNPRLNGYHVIRGKVDHSMKLSDPPLFPWIILEDDGRIITGHCNYIARLAESCTHVASLLIFILFKTDTRNRETVTEKFAYSRSPNNPPLNKKDLQKPISSLDFRPVVNPGECAQPLKLSRAADPGASFSSSSDAEASRLF